jgi:hypothetical protein
MSVLSRPILAAALLLAAAHPALARLPAELTDRSDPDARAVGCEAYLGHEINASPRIRWPRLRAAMLAWRAQLETRMTRDEAAQYFASTFAVLRDTPAATRRAAAAYCLAHAPAGGR